MLLKPNEASNIDHDQNVNFFEKDENEEPIYSSITPYKIKKKTLNEKKSILNESLKHVKIHPLSNEIPEKKITFDFEKKDYGNHHDYYSIFADSFQQSADKLNVKSFSLSDLDKIKIKKPKHSISYKTTKFFSMNNKLRAKFIKKLSDFNHRRPYLERLIRKNGEVNINRVNIASRHRKYISDLFNTVIDMRWAFILLIFSLNFIISWTFFGLLWFIIQYNNNECISNIQNDSFAESFLFSIETQQTIGYGSKYITKNCTVGIFVLIFQASFSVVLHSLMGGIVFAKLSKPKKRTETLIFSNKAVLARRDGVFSLMCRVGDMRRSHIIEASAKMYLIRTRVTKEGEVIPFNTQELKLENQFIFMPVIIEHIIDKSSPLNELISSNSNGDIEENFEFKNNFEILVVLQGILESTGQTTQKKTSFLPSEILFNHIFEPLVDISVAKPNQKATIDYSKFDQTKKIENLTNSLITNNVKHDKTTVPTVSNIFNLEEQNSSFEEINHPTKTTPIKFFVKKINEKLNKSTRSIKSYQMMNRKNTICYKSV